MLTGYDGNRSAWVCLPCQRIVSQEPVYKVAVRGVNLQMEVKPSAQPKLPLHPGPQRRRVVEREEPVQARIIRALTLAGFTVLSTVQRKRRVRCFKCGASQWPPGGTGTTPGVPDLLVCVPGGLVGLEVKGTRTQVRPEQKALARAGHIRIVRSVEEAMEAVRPHVHQ